MPRHTLCFLARHGGAASLAILTAAGLVQSAEATSCCHYGLTITTAATRNVSFRHGVFRAIKKHATLNVDDLENALAAQNIVVTTGNGTTGTGKGDLHIEITGLTWSSKHRLTLDAYHSIFVDEPVTDAGTGDLILTTNDGGQGGMFRYGPGGYITISEPSDVLTINGQVYLLAKDLPTLANEIEANPTGHYALASSYDASNDQYDRSPIATTLTGAINGLGNTISKLRITDTTPIDTAGLLRKVGKTGSVQDLRLSVSIYITEPDAVGGLVGANLGQLIGDSVQSSVGTQSAQMAFIGGLAGTNSGTISRCNVAATVNTDSYSAVGGLAGSDSGGAISQSFVTGSVTANASSIVGGLVGSTAGTSIVDSYSTASVAKGEEGGLVGQNGDTQGNNAFVATSYSTGFVHVTKKGYPQGGLVGLDNSAAGSIMNSYWDTSTSGVTDPSRGAGSPPNDPGITGETTSQLQSGLPAGFSPAIWTETSGFNGGLPYLIANPPPQ